MDLPGNRSVSAVVCTKNSISGIENCLTSLQQAGVDQIIVVDAHSTDGTTEVAQEFADLVLTDPGTGLVNARNIGIAHSTGDYVLNMGSDNVMPPGQLHLMIKTLTEGDYQGVSAQTFIQGSGFIANGLNAWREGRFVPGPTAVIGTPTLFQGVMIRQNPYNPEAIFSDDSELCERWQRDFGATFAISPAHVYEIGKISWNELKIRCHMYGISDHEIYQRGKSNRWGVSRKLKSMLHPLRADFLTPIRNLPTPKAISNTPFLLTFTALRYSSWMRASLPKSGDSD
jgi:glycosyltransferase involved in cell wall biosynthesis